MADWDDLEAQLKDLGAETARLVTDPPPGSEVRRISARRRHRRWAVVSASLLLVVVGAAGYALGSLSPREIPTPVGTPSEVVAPSVGPTATPAEPTVEAGGRGERITQTPQRRQQPAPPTHSTRGAGSSWVTPDASPSPSASSDPSETADPRSPETPDPGRDPESEPEVDEPKPEPEAEPEPEPEPTGRPEPTTQPQRDEPPDPAPTEIAVTPGG